MAYGDFSSWICGCGIKVEGKNGPLPEGWRIAWPMSEDEDGFKITSAFPPPGVYCPTCWNAHPDKLHTADVDTDGKRYRAALVGVYGKENRLADEVQQWTSERLARGKRYEDVADDDHKGIRELIGGAINHRCFPVGPPPDIPGIAMVLHPSAMASGVYSYLYDYLEHLAAHYNEEVHLFWDESRWHLVFIGTLTENEDEELVVPGYNTAKCEFWLVFYPDRTSKILGAS